MAIKKISFRIDASAEIGLGHFMRCFTLALELKKQGALIRFISRNLPPFLQDILNKEGMNFISFSICSVYESIDKVSNFHNSIESQIQDAQETVRILADHFWDWVIVDHYALDSCWEKLIRGSTKKIMVIDDLANRYHECDLLLDQNFYLNMQERYKEKTPLSSKILLGPNFALLKKEFRDLRKQIKPRTGNVQKVLVFLSGADRDNITSQVIEALTLIKNSWRVDVVIGALHPYSDQIQRSCFINNYICHVQTSNIPELMAEADLAIGAGGTASLERCCLGLPALILSLAENQIEIAKSLDSTGACIYLGGIETLNSLIIKESIVELLNSPGRIQMISNRALSIVDGLGVERVCRELAF